MGKFSCSNYEQKRNYKDLFAVDKHDPPPHPHRVIVAQTYLVINIIVDPVSKNMFLKILADLFYEIKNIVKT